MLVLASKAFAIQNVTVVASQTRKQMAAGKPPIPMASKWS